MNDFEIVRVAERALLVRFHDADLARAVARAHNLLARCKEERQRLPEKEEWVLGAGSLLVRLDDSVAPREIEVLRDRLEAWSGSVPSDESPSVGEAFEVAVDFGGESGQDLDQVARECGLTAQEVVTRLCATTLTVAFLGFSPGFPYLIGLPRELEVPRLASPRPRVPAGAVAVAGPFAGIYPSATPGGWRLLGRTELALFDPRRDPPALLVAGDRVRFVPR